MSMALITNIQRFSLDDGPGIRTTAFFKGCPLRCKWCHNPECISHNVSIQLIQKRCHLCGACQSVCPENNHRISDNTHLFNREDCSLCGQCAKECVYGALQLIGKHYTTEELAEQLLMDQSFYASSGGGITLSGGEPLLQAEFCQSILSVMKEKGIHTCVDTSGAIPWESIEHVLPYTDLFLFDLKTSTSSLHKELTGFGNERIIDNFERLCVANARIWVRIPLVANLNDSDEEIEATAMRLDNHPNVERVDLLGYHSMGSIKYASLGLRYEGEQFSSPSKERLEFLSHFFSARGIHVDYKAH